MTTKELISAIEKKHMKDGITLNPPASLTDIQNFEKKLGFELPSDFKEFYSICNGFECTEDFFRISPLGEALSYKQDYNSDWYHFAEYMIYSDMWSLRKRQDDKYEIFNKGEIEIILSTSLSQFVERFLKGNVFDEGGLYDRHEELKLK